MVTKTMPEAAIQLLLQNPFSQRAGELAKVQSELAAFSVSDVERATAPATRSRALLAVLHARALSAIDEQAELSELAIKALVKQGAEHVALTRIACASARCSARLRRLAGTSQALARVRSQVWAACFGKTLLHTSELAGVIRGHDVLIIGETGVGKEELAHAIALGTMPSSGVGAAPFAALNVAAVPETLVEAELFGHVKGAFTGAHAARTGLVRSADGGCLLLDEVGDLPLATQAKLLRVIETDRVQPLGTEQVHAVDVRFVSATHHDLAERVAQGSFRPDLYQRVGALVIRVPPLRERPEDVPAIGARLLRAATEHASSVDTRPVERWLKGPEARSYHWPGNARELRSVVSNLLLGLPLGLSREPPELPSGAAQLPRSISEAQASWATVQHWYMKRVLAHVDGNVAQAARVLGLDRTTVLRKLAQARTSQEK
jgi:DNA-binding NtrC family response regulator